jgi:hypothetical protein
MALKINYFLTDLWGCPSGYVMLELNCYKLVRSPKMFAEAELACLADGGKVAKPITLLQVILILNMPPILSKYRCGVGYDPPSQGKLVIKKNTKSVIGSLLPKENLVIK